MATPIPGNRARFTAAEIAIATGGVLVRGAPEAEAIGVCTDSRAVASGNVFVPLVGERSDGHAFVGDAIAAGAAIVVVARAGAIGKKSVEGAVAVIVVDDTLVALGALARAHRHRWAREKTSGSALIAITGSAGKTTTKELCAAALGAAVGHERVHVTRGNLNNRIGLPLTLLGLEAHHDVAVIEAGTSVRGEIATLAAICEPDVALLTHVGVAHAEGLGEPSMSAEQAVAREKRALLAAARSFAIAPADEAWGRACLIGVAAEALTFGRAESADHRLVHVEPRADGTTSVGIARGAETFSISLPLLGDAAARDLCGAICAADAALSLLGFDELEAARLDASIAASIRPVAGRLSPRRRGDGALVLDDSYNASPSAYAESIRTARALASAGKRRLIVVAGEMRELGSIAGTAHELVGLALVDASPALVIAVGEGAARIAAATSAAGIETHHAIDARAAVKLIEARVEPNDLVLVKGSRGVTTEVVVEGILAAILAPHGENRQPTLGGETPPPKGG